MSFCDEVEDGTLIGSSSPFIVDFSSHSDPSFLSRNGSSVSSSFKTLHTVRPEVEPEGLLSVSEPLIVWVLDSELEVTGSSTASSVVFVAVYIDVVVLSLFSK